MLGRIVGDESRLAFLPLASLRSQLIRQPGLTILTMLAIALSVALVIALVLSSRSVERALSSSAEALRGRADLEVTAGAVGMPESLLDEISGLPGIAAAAPVIQTTVRIVGGPKDGRPVRIIGVDLLADQSVRSYTVIQRSLHVLDPLMLVAKSDSVIVSEILARELKLSEGDAFTVRSAVGERPIVVRGLLAAGGVGDAYASQVAVMDVYALQAMLQRQGWLDRIDLVLAPGASVAEVRARVAEKVEGVASVREPDPGNQLAGEAISMLRFIVSVVALFGVLVSALMCYAAVASSVDRRTRVFALFQAAGLEAKNVHRLVRLDALVIAIGGVVVGTPVGIWLSTVFAAIFSQTSNWLAGLEVKPAPASPAVILLGAGVGIGVGQIAGALASRRSTRLAPHEAMAGGRGLGFEPANRPAARAWWPALLVLCAWLVAWKAPLPIAGTHRAAILFALGIALLWTSIGPFLALVLPSFRAIAQRLAPGIGAVASESLLMRLNQTRITVASIAALVAATSSIWIVTVSVVETLDQGGSLHGATQITANDFMDQSHRDLIRDGTVREVVNTPGIVAVSLGYGTQTIFRGEPIRIGGITSEIWAQRLGFGLTDQVAPDADIAHALQAGGVIAYETFRRHFGKTVGDSVELDTPLGKRAFPIVGVRPVYNNTSSTGGLIMDLATFDRYWPRAGATSLLVWTRGDDREVLDEVQRRAGVIQPLFFIRGEDLERFGRDTLARYSGLIDGLVCLIGLFAGAAVVNLLAGASAELRGDMALLQCLGAARRQLLGLVLIEGLALGLAGVVAGLLFAAAFAVPLGSLFTEQFGWVISWSFHPVELVLLAACTLGISALVGLVAATRLRRAIAWSALAPE